MCTDVNRQKRPIHTSASESDSGSNSDAEHNSKGYTKHKVARKKKTAFPHLPPPPPPPVTHPRPLASLASAYSQPAPLSPASNSLPRPPAPLPLPASCPPCAQPPLAAPDCQPSVTPPTESSLPGYIFSVKLILFFLTRILSTVKHNVYW